jgi:hypothetical protein
LFGYVGSLSIVIGVLYFIGFLTPYYEANLYEKSRTNVLGSIFSTPLFVLMLIASSTSLNSFDTKSPMIIGIILSCLLIILSIWIFFSGLNTLKKVHKKK